MFPPRPRPLGKAAPAGGKVQPGGRSVPDAAQKTTVGFNATGLPDDRILFVAQVLVGYKVEVQVKDGTIYEGILHSMRPEGKDVNVVLHWARPVRGPGAASAPPAVKQCVIPSADLVQILAKNVDLSEEELSRPLNGANAFETDSEISKGRGGVERELTRWQPDTSVEEPDMSLNASTFGRPNAGSVTGWDQFETNRQKFQVKSTWDENLYTTKLDKSKAGISVAEAERIAADIERQATRNRHMAEERGIRDNTVQELDEEELYSSVARAAPDEDVAMRPADADNDVTFGADASSDGSKAASNSGRDPADGARKPAWANAGAGVAVVSGRGASWEPPGKVRTAPVAVVDPRKEHNKLRLQMTGGAMLKGKDRSSPSSYGTPKGLRSPLSSPLVGDSIQVEALDLNPGVAKIDRKTRKEFEEFKTKRKEGAGVGDMRSLSHELPSSGGRKPGGEQPPLSSSAGSSSKAGGLGVSPSAPSSISSDVLPAPPSTSAPPAAPATAPGAAGGQPGQSNGQPPRPPTSKSSLNPNAKSFQFNPNAKDFKPTFSAGTTPAGTPFGTPAATPPATPAHSIASAPGAFRQNSFGSSHFGGPGGASQWLGSRSHSGGGPSPHSAGQRKFDRQMERAWGEDGRGGANMDREHGRNGPGGVPPPHGGNQMHPMAASAGLQMPAGSGHMGGPVGVPMGGPPGQWAVPPQFVPGQPFMPMVPGSPQQPQMMTYMGRPYGPPPQGFLVRPGGMPGSPYAGGMMYAPAPPGMHPGGPGGPRPQMFPAPGMMMQGGPGMAPMGMPGPHMGMPGTPGGHPGEQQGGPGPHGSPEQRHRGPGGGHQFHSPTKP